MGFIRAFRAETTNLQVQTSGLRAQLDSAQAEAQLTQSRLEGELAAKAEAVQTLQIDLAAVRVDLKSFKKKLRNSKDKRLSIDVRQLRHYFPAISLGGFQLYTTLHARRVTCAPCDMLRLVPMRIGC